MIIERVITVSPEYSTACFRICETRGEQATYRAGSGSDVANCRAVPFIEVYVVYAVSRNRYSQVAAAGKHSDSTWLI